MLTSRRGATLIELLIAVVIGGIVLGAATTVSVAQQRLHRTVAEVLASEEQIRHADAILPVALRALTPSLDLLQGGSRDSSLEVMETIAAGIVCATDAGMPVITPPSTAGASLGSRLSAPQAGDSAWLLVAGDAGARWRGYAITGIRGGSCDATFGAVAAHPGAIALDLMPAPVPPPAGGAARITRRSRYSVYRGSDGAWYLGYQTWSPAVNRYGTVQPASGPYGSPRGRAFFYFDSSGAVLPLAARSPAAVARIELHVRPALRVMPATAETQVAVTPRNRP